MAPYWKQVACAALFSTTISLSNGFVSPTTSSRVATMQSPLSMSMADTVASHVDGIPAENLR